LKIVGVFVAPSDDTYTFETNSDDGSYVYLGQHAKGPAKALVKNGGHHGMRRKSATMKMTKGMEQQFVLTFWQHFGGVGLQFNIKDSKGRPQSKANHFESSQQRWYSRDL